MNNVEYGLVICGYVWLTVVMVGHAVRARRGK